jgi:2'-hydroxyisoflavone reductase
MNESISRRVFVKRSAAGALGLGVGSGWCGSDVGRRGLVAQATAESSVDLEPLRILILGGTGFIGPHQVRYALERGHTVTLFNRGRSAPQLFAELFDDVEQLVGDRADNLDALRGREWDVALDNSGYEPAHVRASSELLRGAVGRYLFVSTQSVYADRSIIDQDESGAVGIPGVPQESWEGYGPLKALCEKEARAAFGDRLTVVRPAVIVGPGDRTDRFTYWVVRTDRGGDVLAPGRPQDPAQFIDVRDVTEFMIHLLENDESGTYNATGPAEPLTFRKMLETMRSVTDSDARFTWVSSDFLEEHEVRPFSDVPMWMPPEGSTAGFLRMSPARAIAAGLTYRSLSVTVEDLLAWCRTEPAERWQDMRAGLSPEREAELLAEWRDRA